MIVPKKQMKYCPFCRKHTEHEIKRLGVGRKRRTMAQGERRFARMLKGFGSFPRPNPHDRAKPTRKLDLSYRCAVCKRWHNIGKGYRVKKFEITK